MTGTGADRPPSGRSRGAAHLASAPRPAERQRDAARDLCLTLLTAAPRTRQQLADAMRRRAVPDDIAEEVLGRLADVGLVDDAAFARAWVHSRHQGRGLARRALAVELRRRGVADDQVSEAVETLDPDQEMETARRLVQRKLGATRGQPLATRVRRLTGILTRKGYPPTLAYQLAREAVDGDPAEGGPPVAGETAADRELPRAPRTAHEANGR